MRLTEMSEILICADCPRPTQREETQSKLQIWIVRLLELLIDSNIAQFSQESWILQFSKLISLPDLLLITLSGNGPLQISHSSPFHIYELTTGPSLNYFLLSSHSLKHDDPIYFNDPEQRQGDINSCSISMSSSERQIRHMGFCDCDEVGLVISNFYIDCCQQPVSFSNSSFPSSIYYSIFVIVSLLLIDYT